MNPDDYDSDGNNIVPCPICLDVYCPSKEGGKCPDEEEFVKSHMKKLNPKKNKEARRKRNPLVVVGVGVPGKKNMFYKVQKTCPNCTLRSMGPHDETCEKCRREKEEERNRQLGIDPSSMTPVNNS